MKKEIRRLTKKALKLKQAADDAYRQRDEALVEAVRLGYAYSDIAEWAGVSKTIISRAATRAERRESEDASKRQLVDPEQVSSLPRA